MAKRRTSSDQEVLYGMHPIIELLRAKRRKMYALYTTKPTPKGFGVIEQLIPKHVSIQYVSRDRLHVLAGSTDHQGVVALVSPYPFFSKPFDPIKHPCLVLLDGVQDVRNVGAIIRSAYCTGFNGVILPKKRTAPLLAAALKASAGLAEHMLISQPPSSQHALTAIATAGYAVYLTTFDGDNAATISYEHPLCLVIGAEGTGIDRSLLKMGMHITLPQRSGDVSYNASVAAGITMFLISRGIGLLSKSSPS